MTREPMHNLAASYDVEAIRRDFPIFRQTMYGKPLTFLDSGASAQKPQVVIDAISQLYGTAYANIHRGVYKLSQDATEAYEGVRETVRRFINAERTDECLFTQGGATEGINLVANTWGRQNLKAGDEILLTQLEHHANIVPWQMLRDATGVAIKVIPVDDRGAIEMAAYAELLKGPVKLVAMPHISNAIGTILAVKEMTAMAHAAGATVLIDGCQAIPRMTVDVRDLDADFYVFSGHKVYGPTGIGVLYGKAEILADMPPWQGGGDMIETVTFEKTTYNVPPHRFEAGTPHIAGGIGLGAALDYVSALGLDAIGAHEHALMNYALDQLQGLNSVRIIGTAPERTGIVSFVMEAAHPHDIGTILDREGVAVRAGHHCAQPVMARFGVTATVRASFGLYNNREDVDRLIAAINKVTDIFG